MMRRWELLALRLGAAQGVLMALYHFTLPRQFGWAKYVSADAPTVGWALLALNNYFSFILLIISGTFAFFLFTRTKAIGRIVLLASLLTVFWIFSFGYQALRPMPLPAELSWLGLLLPGVAAVNALLLGLPAWRLGMRIRMGIES